VCACVCVCMFEHVCVCVCVYGCVSLSHTHTHTRMPKGVPECSKEEGDALGVGHVAHKHGSLAQKSRPLIIAEAIKVQPVGACVRVRRPIVAAKVLPPAHTHSE
jgi:hypothetical protein